jgi:predicted transcriptional regulator
MLRGPKVFQADYALFIALSEPQARRRVSLAYNLPSGAIIVLITVAALHEIGECIRPKQVYAARLMSPSLLRKYMAGLVGSNLVQRYTKWGRARLRLTAEGMTVCADYRRYLLVGARQYLKEQAIG